MYGSDYDDMAVLVDNWNGTSIQGQTWVTLLFPYTKNKDISFDPARRIPSAADLGTNNWFEVTTLALNDTGVSSYWQADGCNDHPYWGNAWIPGRSLSAQENIAERGAVIPNMVMGTNAGRYWIRNWQVSWADFDKDYASYQDTGWWEYNMVWQTRLAHSGKTIPVGYLDGHAGKINKGKFVGWSENGSGLSYDQYCTVMNQRGLFKFWGKWWTTTE
jgi:prepilin-type processing-associated H-X9-DG protein